MFTLPKSFRPFRGQAAWLLGLCIAIALLPAAALTAMAGGRTAAAITGRTIYVSPSGNDSGPGTEAKPLRTLFAARSLVRRIDGDMKSNITVYLAPGTYRLGRTLQLGPEDSGTNGFDVEWTSVPGGKTMISGAQRVRGWTKTSGPSGIWQAKVPSGLDTRQLYVNGQRATLASGPVPVHLTETATGYRASSAAMARWRNPSDIEFVYTAQLGLMVEPICPIGSIDGSTITMAQPCWNNSNDRANNLVGFGKLGQPSYVEDAFELLKRPGQFYLDRTARRLYYIPRAGQNMTTADVEAPVLQTLIAGAGSASRPIHNITFENLQFSYATWLQPGTPTGFSDMQVGYTITGHDGAATEGLCQTAPHGTCPYGDWTKEPGNLTFRYDRSIDFTSDWFVGLGAAGLNLDDGSQDNVVTGCVFTDISGNGLQIGSVDRPNATGAAQTSGVQVTNNHLYGLPVEYHGGVAILAGYTAHTLISHNQIDHVPYSGISMGWGGWPDKRDKPAVANTSEDNVISDNLIFDFMQTLSDGGAVYTLGITGASMSTGQKVTGNVIYNQLAWGRALQSDDGATYVTYTGNALWDDNYDWGTTHVDYRYHDGRYDATSVTGNYWQQGDPTSSVKGVVITHNTLIPDENAVPAAIRDNAGIQADFRSILAWNPSGENFPDAPYEVTPLYAFGGKAYVTWRPSYVFGAHPVASYTVTACAATGGVAAGGCAHPAGSVTLSAGEFADRGYATIGGLRQNESYSFSVVANSLSGASTPSTPSLPVTVIARKPAVPGAPKSLDVQAGNHLVRLIWYAPSGSRVNPILSYRVTPSGGGGHTVGGLRPLVVSTSGGRVVDVISGLTPGKSYVFSVSAHDPSGSGPAARFAAATPAD